MARSLHVRMLIGAAMGLGLGVAAHLLLDGTAVLDVAVRYIAQPIGQVFLRLLFMLVLPLVFSSLVLGVAELGDVRRIGRIGLRTLAVTVVTSSLAVAIGVFLVNLLQPGAGLSPETRSRLLEGAAQRSGALPSATAARGGIDLIVQMVPDNPLRAATNGDMLAVMVFALLFGIALSVVRSEGARRLLEVIQGLYDVTMRLIGWVIRLAPVGVAALLFVLAAQLGYAVLGQLARFVGVVLLALGLQLVVVYSALVKFGGGMSPWAFFRGSEAAMLTAFSTASSNATLPTALRVAETELKLPARVARFVLTIGSTANQNGTALFEGVTVLFLAQFYGVELTLAQQVLVSFVAILGGIGTAGVPAGSLPVVAMILGMVGIPPEGIGVILGVDRFLDMCRTTVNVTGDLAVAVVVARGEAADAEPTRAVGP
ncbi:MAG: dicarboxylate/amino acid:cation symporter [Acidobacteria bacterium]|jgi:DAACS family dicarboxylate/amino acid:cation (Na+ or H+) symporter|nr:dicarboxylate/amino acid:cation symporter [Acidobacteriota bacterium]MCU0253315.1 dicarboxylate/amino acid:cation symporter [Acidobacteriota bacterium]